MASESENDSCGFVEPSYQESHLIETNNHITPKVPKLSAESRLSARSVPLDLKSLRNPSSQLWATALDFTQALKDMEVRGPLDLTDHCDDKVFIAKGGQFAVYHNTVAGWNSDDPGVILPVVVKRCLIELKRGEILDLNISNTRRQVHNMYLEVLALQDENLKNHRNIVKLLGWSFETGFNAMPLLVMERAVCDLARFLNDDDSMPITIRHQLCLDMCAGLDALHSNDIVHADLKPENILVFKNDWDAVPYIGKLADFGLSAGASDVAFMAIAGWSEGWQAPEIDKICGQAAPHRITVGEYYQADKYSLGLIIWSTFCNKGKPLRENTKRDASIRALEAMKTQEDMPSRLKHTTSSVLSLLLSYKNSGRPDNVMSLWHDSNRDFENWDKDCKYMEGHLDKSVITKTFATDDEFAPQDISSFLLIGLTKALNDFDHAMSGGELLSAFLYKSYESILDEDISIDSVFIRALLSAAKGGFLPARAIFYRVLQSHGIQWPTSLEKEETSWLYEGVTIGCKIALADLENHNHEKAIEAIKIFRQRGGLLQLYASTKERHDWEKAIGHMKLTQHKADEIDNIDVSNLNFSETDFEDCTLEDLLYLACIAGSTNLLKRICDQGCDASVTKTPHGITCLHWLFAFPSADMDTVAATLIDRGALINAHLKTNSPIRNINFPYSLPPGTPLHWATASSNVPAVVTLLSHGADLGIRNGVDPYKYNRDVRSITKESKDDTVGGYSVPAQPCQGLTIFDLAAANHDWQLLQAISDLKRDDIPINDTDEEGFTAFHRLESNWVGRTWTGSRYWYSSFSGSQQMREKSISLTIKALITMGGDINQLTNISRLQPGKVTFPGNMTPLMLAVRSMDLTTVKSLLAFGADPNIRNESQYNALSMLPERSSPEISLANLQAICDALIEHGIDVDAPGCYAGADPLACAVRSANLEVVRALLHQGASTEKNHGVSIAAMILYELPVQEFFLLSKHTRQGWDSRCLSIVGIIQDYFLGETDRTYAVDPQGGSLLHYAVVSGCTEVVRYLLSQIADPNRSRQKLVRDPNSKYTWHVLLLPAHGTALDICMERVVKLEKDSARNQLNISPQIYTTMIECYKDIEKMLVEKEAKTSEMSM